MIPIILVPAAESTERLPLWLALVVLIPIFTAFAAVVIWAAIHMQRGLYFSKCSICGKRLKNQTREFRIEGAPVCEKCFNDHRKQILT